MILYYIKKIRPWHSQTNLSISILIFGKSYYSQTVTYFLDVDISLRHLQNYTTLKQCQADLQEFVRFRHLQNHTTLKQRLCFNFLVFSLRHLQNYTTLKPFKNVLD